MGREDIYYGLDKKWILNFGDQTSRKTAVYNTDMEKVRQTCSSRLGQVDGITSRQCHVRLAAFSAICVEPAGSKTEELVFYWSDVLHSRWQDSDSQLGI